MSSRPRVVAFKAPNLELLLQSLCIYSVLAAFFSPPGFRGITGALAVSPPTNWIPGSPAAGLMDAYIVGYLKDLDQAGYDDNNGEDPVNNTGYTFDKCVEYIKALDQSQVDLFYHDFSDYQIIWGGDLNWISPGKYFADSNYGVELSGQTQASWSVTSGSQTTGTGTQSTATDQSTGAPVTQSNLNTPLIAGLASALGLVLVVVVAFGLYLVSQRRRSMNNDMAAQSYNPNPAHHEAGRFPNQGVQGYQPTVPLGAPPIQSSGFIVRASDGALASQGAFGPAGERLSEISFTTESQTPPSPPQRRESAGPPVHTAAPPIPVFQPPPGMKLAFIPVGQVASSEQSVFTEPMATASIGSLFPDGSTSASRSLSTPPAYSDKAGTD
ncbi:hypothetical protein HK405_015458 [Cladochytrium tenue]|nr:hypothetical protein HK405_015458 [Cladochytrium tenue]